MIGMLTTVHGGKLKALSLAMQAYELGEGSFKVEAAYQYACRLYKLKRDLGAMGVIEQALAYSQSLPPAPADEPEPEIFAPLLHHLRGVILCERGDFEGALADFRVAMTAEIKDKFKARLRSR
jgi:hypothetical protein